MWIYSNSNKFVIDSWLVIVTFMSNYNFYRGTIITSCHFIVNHLLKINFCKTWSTGVWKNDDVVNLHFSNISPFHERQKASRRRNLSCLTRVLVVVISSISPYMCNGHFLNSLWRIYIIIFILLSLQLINVIFKIRVIF